MTRIRVSAALVLALTAVLCTACGGSHRTLSPEAGQTAQLLPIVPKTITIPPGRRHITGASQARCTPSPCTTPAGPITYTLTGVSNGDGTTSTRQYAVLRPGGLVPSASNRAPAVLMFYAGANCGYQGAGRWPGVATTNRFIVVAMEVSCTGVKNWRKANIDALGYRRPNDQPYVAAVVRAIESCPGQCVDPRRVYAVGISSGANMTADIMCDKQNSALFRGYLIDSSSLATWHGIPNCPTTNVGYFVMLAISNYSSVDRGLYYDTDPHAHLDVHAFATWAAHRLRCRGPLQRGQLGTAIVYSYSAPCAFATRGVAIQALGVINGGHGWGCQDSDPGAPPNGCPGMSVPPGLGSDGKPRTGGLFIEGTFWRQVARGRS